MTQDQFANQSVVITGASSGIGRACALHLDQLGYRVFAGVRKPGDGSALQETASSRLTPLILDVTAADSIGAAQGVVARAAGANGLFGLINNAGFALAGPIEFQSVDDLRQQLEVNLIGAVSVTQAFIPLLRQGRGRIINMSSIAGVAAMPFLGNYAATKSALEAVSDALRVELRPWGIAVSIVEPGDVQTPIWRKGLEAADKMLAAWPPQAFVLYGPMVEMMRKMAQGERGIPPDEVAKVVGHLMRAKAPRARVLVGNDAKLVAMIERMPAPLRDWLIARQLPKYG
jgi:NAD(P)-dependent dehydrogenase (short-subunit alcohol dehydrogenase family)